MDALRAALAGYVNEVYTDLRGREHVVFRTDDGRKVVDVDTSDDKFYAVAYVNYGGDDGLKWADSKTTKTSAAAARFAKGFLK